jgi:hypothetical protein
MGLLDGSDSEPPKTIDAEDANQKKIRIENPDYVASIAKDQHMLRFLLNSLSPDILSHVLGMNTTAEAWKAINAMFKTASRTKAQQLREKLNDTKKLTMTADQYFTKMKGFSSELSALGKPIEEEELLGYLLHGLDKTEYNALITSVHGNPNTTLDEFYEQLCGYDMRNGVSARRRWQNITLGIFPLGSGHRGSQRGISSDRAAGDSGDDVDVGVDGENARSAVAPDVVRPVACTCGTEPTGVWSPHASSAGARRDKGAA